MKKLLSKDLPITVQSFSPKKAKKKKKQEQKKNKNKQTNKQGLHLV